MLRGVAGVAALLLVLTAACGGGDDGAGPASDSDAGADARSDAGWPSGDGAVDAPPPTPRDPCALGACWSAPDLGGFCGTSTSNENFATGLYNVHDYPVSVPAGVTADLTLTVTDGAWEPALVVHAEDGSTLYDGEIGVAGDDPAVEAVSSGRGVAVARLRLTPKQDTLVDVFVTSWEVIDGGFAPALPADATYQLSALLECEPPAPGTLLSPPNFDPNAVQNGFYQLPPSEPPGLYTLKGSACSWGTKLLIDVIYTVATHWKPLYPALSPISVRDLNENTAACGTNHATHDDGTHVDIVAGCATSASCADKAPKIALAKLFIDTGVACGILNNDAAVHDEVNAYFAQTSSYAPWNGEFMRSVTGHDSHFHVRVQKPDGTCN